MERSVVNRKNGSVYRMVPASKIDGTEEQISNLVSICNQHVVYDFLFKNRLGGRLYGVDDARGFLEWARNGWQEQTHFVFLLLDTSGLIAACLDIKSSDRAMAEIGYWSSEIHRGLMSEAVGHLKSIALEGSFKALYARVRKSNIASIKVLERNNFVSHGDWPGDSDRLRYEVILSG
jgi:RimJ/RimL family protein N-acetyltransferase